MDLRFLDVSEDFQRVELGDSKVPFPSEADRHVGKVGIIDGLVLRSSLMNMICAELGSLLVSRNILDVHP